MPPKAPAETVLSIEIIIMQSELVNKYSEIERKFFPVMDYLEKYKQEEPYKSLYKGFITLQSPLFLNPEILFLGINPGQGAFIENKNNGVHETIRIFEPDKQLEFDWYKKGNARCKKINGKWVKGYEWFERNKGVNNQFVANMIELLYEVAKLKYPNEDNVSDTLPSWFETFGQKIMFTNLYPIATKEAKDLNEIIKLLKTNSEVNALFANTNDEWQVKLYFVKRIRELIKLVKPKVIVCLGFTAFDDFTFNGNKRIYTVGSGEKIAKTDVLDIPVIGFSRKGSWKNLLPKIAEEIYKSSQKNQAFNKVVGFAN